MGTYFVNGQVGQVFVGVQPLVGVEGDPMRLLFEKDLTPHPQYAAYYKWMHKVTFTISHHIYDRYTPHPHINPHFGFHPHPAPYNNPSPYIIIPPLCSALTNRNTTPM